MINLHHSRVLVPDPVNEPLNESVRPERCRDKRMSNGAGVEAQAGEDGADIRLGGRARQGRLHLGHGGHLLAARAGSDRFDQHEKPDDD